MVAILTSTVFRSAALSRGEVLIRGRRLFQREHSKEQRLFEARRLLEEIRYTTSHHQALILLKI